MKPKWWIASALALSFVAAVVVVFEPTRICLGLLRGETFHRNRPTSYWREVLRKDGQAGIISENAVECFKGPTAIPVLLECLDDKDRNVRWTAVNRLGPFAGRGFTDRVMPGLRKALADKDPEVRLQALMVLAHIGPDGQGAMREIIALLHDPEAQVCHYADLALWEVHTPTAIEAGGWKPFSSLKWNFSATFPTTQPEEDEKQVERWGHPIEVHSFSASHEVTRCSVAVSEYPSEIIAAASEKERLESSQDWIILAADGKLRWEKDIEQGGLKGRECEIEVEGKGVIRTRLFWVKQRLYQVLVAYDPRFLIPKAADYFLDSFRLEKERKGQ